MNLGYEFTFRRAIISFPTVSYTFSSPFPAILLFGSVIVYILLVYCALQTTWWRKIVVRFEKLHYIALFIYSTVSFLAAFYELINSGEGNNFVSWLFSFSGSQSQTPPRLYCTPVSLYLRYVSLSFILSKIWEWFDTLILIANGKKLNDIGFLHLYHHATTFALFLITTSFPVTEKAGLLLNGLVHSLMYYHFAFRLPRFIRPILTGIQIIQLVVVTLAWIECSRVCVDAITFRKNHPIEFVIPFLLVPVYILFFIIFFVEQYIVKVKKV
jgi:hypothetical protein